MTISSGSQVVLRIRTSESHTQPFDKCFKYTFKHYILVNDNSINHISSKFAGVNMIGQVKGKEYLLETGKENELCLPSSMGYNSLILSPVPS